MSATMAALLTLLGLALIYWGGTGLGLFVPKAASK